MDGCDRVVPSIEGIVPSIEDVISLSTAYPYGFEMVDHHEAMLSEAELKPIRNWLSPTDYLSDHSEFSRHLASHAPGTGVWLSELDAYREWHDSANRGSLWVKGVPGAGKSVIAASMIDHFFRTEPEVPVLFFFFRQIIHANRRRRSMLCDWLAQLLPHSSTLQVTLMPLIKASQDEVPDQVLWECLLKALSSKDRVYCVVDALDESEGINNDPFFRRLNELATFRPASVKLLMTSRPRQDLQSILRAESIVHISLEETRVSRDIHAFVLHKLTVEIPELDVSERDELTRAIGKRSAGLFLYARLLIDQLMPELQKGRSVNVEKLPVGLESMYNSVLSRQSAQLDITTDVQVFILGCVTQCLRPLRLLELASLLSIYLQSDMTPAQAKAMVKQACGPLLEVQDDEIVQVIHHSFTEFLLDPQQRTSKQNEPSSPQFPLIDPKSLHKRLAILCLNLLRQQWIPSYKRHQQKEKDALSHFYAYAEQFWVQHLQYDPQTNDTDLFDAMNALCDINPGPFHEWASKIAVPGFGQSFLQPPCLASLHLAAHCGLLDFARRLVDSGSLVCLDGVQHNTTGPLRPGDLSGHPWSCLPLWWACRQGQVQMVEYLLPKTWPLPAMGNRRVSFDRNLVEVTASQGHASVLSLLLKAGFGPLGFVSGKKKTMREVVKYYTAGCLAVTLPYLDEVMVQELLCLYAKKGDAEAMKSILSNTKINVNARFEGRTPLYWTCWAHDVELTHEDVGDSGYITLLNKGSIECVRLLLKAGASVTALSDPPHKKEGIYSRVLQLYVESNRTPLHGLASAWSDHSHEVCCEIFGLLKRAGADLEARDGLGDTPLLALFPDHHAQAHITKPLRFLLENGAKPSVRDKDGLTVLHRALQYHRDPSLVQLLVKHGADVNALASVKDRGQDRQDVSPLEVPFDDPKRYSLVRTDPKVEERQRTKAKDWVAENQAIARVLVDHGANIDAGGQDRALLKALSVCDADTLNILLASRRNKATLQKVLFALDGVYRSTPSDRPLGEMVASLVAAGASLEETNDRGHTPLLHSVDEPELFKTLLEAGANRFAVDSEGNGVLQILVSRRHRYTREAIDVEKLRFYVELGFDPRGLNSKGDSLLHLAIAMPEPTRFGLREKTPVLLPLLKQLIDYGISPRSTNVRGMTPLHVFFDNMTDDWTHSSSPEAEATSPEAVNKIIELLKASPDGLDINSRDADSLTPLHIAAMSLSPNAAMCIDVLIGHGADIQAITDSGRTALHLACIARNTSVIPFLLDRAGLDLIHIKDSSGRTALFDACMSGVLESVALLLDSGAQVDVQDAEGKTPLHACAEFVFEQARWKIVEYARAAREVTPNQPYKDRYRPFKATFSDLPNAKRPWQRRRRERGLFSGDSSEDSCFKSYSLENESAAIYSVVKRMLEAGAENIASDEFKLTPAEYAWYNRCDGMMAAFEKLGRTDLDCDLAAQLALTKLNRLSLVDLKDDVKEEIIQHPTRYISQFDDEGMEWLVSEGANLFTTFSVRKNDSSFQTSLGRESTIPDLSFMHNIALLGLTTFMERLGATARYFDSPSNKVDRWIIARSAGFDNERLKADSTWDLEKLATTCTLKIRPLVYQACTRRARNMEMIKVLVAKCGADVNAREIRYSYSTMDRNALGAVTALGYMALTQEYWHLEAIRYLVSRGADINVKDVNGQTPLIIACYPQPRQPRRWAPLFVKLLLELGADPDVQDSNGKTCFDLVASQEILDVLVAGGANVASSKAQLLSTSIKTFNLSLMRRALDEGADPSESNDVYSWRSDLYPSQIKNKDRYPLISAILHSGNQKPSRRDEIPVFRKRRRDAISLLLERGADSTVMLESGTRLLHAIVSEVVCDVETLDLVLKCSSPESFNTTDSSGRSVFLASCNSRGNPNLRLDDYGHDASGSHVKLLDLGADIMAVDNNGMNALHIMLDNLFMPTSRILSFLERPAARTLALAKDSLGRTPLDYALRILRPEVCDVLLDMGAVPNVAAAFNGGMTPLHFIAAQCLERSLIRYELPFTVIYMTTASTAPDHFPASIRLWNRFIDAGFAVDTPDKDGQPPLFGYLCRGEPFYDHRVRNDNGTNPASPSGDVDTQSQQPPQVLQFEALFGNANLKARNNRGETALHIIASQPRRLNDVAMFKLLVDKGLDPLAEDHTGRSSLDVASETEKVNILELFRKKN